MKYWDSSALVPLLVEEETTAPLQETYRGDQEVMTWWGTEVECASAIARLERQGDLDASAAVEAYKRLDAFAQSWQQIEPAPPVRETARRFLRVHDLRAADALQLAAAFLAAEGRPPTLELLCLDDRLTLAAQREGFSVTGRDDLLQSPPAAESD
jgi:predicted nucleic acid-binding protein